MFTPLELDSLRFPKPFPETMFLFQYHHLFNQLLQTKEYLILNRKELNTKGVVRFLSRTDSSFNFKYLHVKNRKYVNS